MEFIHSVLTIVTMFIVLLMLDFIWLGYAIQQFIVSEFKSLITLNSDGSINVNIIAGLIAWFAIVLGCFIFVVTKVSSVEHALMLGAVFGIITYIIYDLTNLTFITNYPVRFIFVDILWGGVLCSIVSGVGFLVKKILPTLL